MRATNRLRWAAVAALSCALPVIAHHSFSAEFDSGKTVTLRGTDLQSRLDQSAHLRLCGREGRRRKDDHLGAAIAASAVLQRQRADQGRVAEQQAGGDRHGEPRQGRHAGLRVHDQVELSGRPCIQHVSAGCRPQSAEDAEVAASQNREEIMVSELANHRTLTRPRSPRSFWPRP